MATQDITNEQVLKTVRYEIGEIRHEINELRHDVLGIKKDISIIYWVLGGFLALILFVGGLLFFTWGDVKTLQVEVQVQQELADLRAQVENK